MPVELSYREGIGWGATEDGKPWERLEEQPAHWGHVLTPYQLEFYALERELQKLTGDRHPLMSRRMMVLMLDAWGIAHEDGRITDPEYKGRGPWELTEEQKRIRLRVMREYADQIRRGR